MARIRDIAVQCARPSSLARFWAAALDGYRVAPYDEAELERLRGMGVDDPDEDPSVLVEADPGVRPRFFFTLVPEPAAANNRTHLDLDCDDFDAESARLVELGARIVARHEGWTIMADPEGNEFCLFHRA